VAKRGVLEWAGFFVLVGTVGIRYKACSPSNNITVEHWLEGEALEVSTIAKESWRKSCWRGSRKGVGHGDETEGVRRGEGRGSRDGVVGALDVLVML